MVSTTDLPTKECRNSLSARTQPDVVSELIEKEVFKGFLYGPFKDPPFQKYRVSPIGIAEGKYSGKKRLILDLSSPHNDDKHLSINDLIDKQDCSMSYVRIDDAIDVILKFGRNSWLCKFDISDAFKNCPIIPKNNYKVNSILHLLDDFLTIDPPDADGERTMAIMMMIFKKLNIPIAKHKTIGPVKCLEYLGIILDSEKMKARLPLNKVDRICEFIKKLCRKKSCTKRELLQLLGHLNFASRVILPGRSFVSYLIGLSTTVNDLHHYVKLDKECRVDLEFWLLFLSSWNGVNMFYSRQFFSSYDMELLLMPHQQKDLVDISRENGFYSSWPSNIAYPDKTFSMAFLELYPIVVSAILWGSQWTTKRILFWCDTEVTVAIIERFQTSFQCSTTSNEVPKQLRCNVVLNQAVNELWNSAIANTTRTVYDIGFRKFETFMLLNAHCFKVLSLQYSTIKLYLCGIRYKYVQGNQNDPLQSAHNTPLIRLDYVFKFCKRLQKTKNHIRLPITFEILEKIVNCLRKGFCSKFTDLMLRTACIVAFYGFLRCGEFTVSKASQFDPHINLCIEDVVFHTDLVVLKLKQSKTDPFRKGINIQLHKLGQLICPYTILLEYIQIRKELSPTNQTDPLFITIDKKPLERQYFITCIKKVLDICGFNSSHYNGHSFRIGAATSAGKAKIEDHLIKTLGRWTSDSYTRYIRVTPASIKTAQSRLGRI
ncbi:unnamed protein product [Mytilus edulis]|uniref:Tyr recombinase domain-containing protein n=1 Tax=Mytilus edulis TaxID=6550 RepID=A0A8S3RD98_MYTED|nr:unnamed protein product [Mytilus edulis]